MNSLSNRASKRGQASIEYLMLVGTVLLIIAFISGYSFLTFSQTNSNNLILSSLKNLEGAINTVSALGEGNSVVTGITLPSGVTRFDVGNTYIFVEIEELGSKSSATSEFDVNLTGVLPTSQGIYDIQVKNVGGVVSLNVV